MPLTLAYIGPAGIGSLGVLVVVVLVLLVGAFGLLLYPIRLFLSYRRSRSEQLNGGETPGQTGTED